MSVAFYGWSPAGLAIFFRDGLVRGVPEMRLLR